MTDDRNNDINFRPAPELEGCADDGPRPFGSWSKVGIGVGAAAAMAGAAYAASRYIGRGNESEDEAAFRLRLETDENVRLISSRKVEGTAVYGSDGARLGTIDNFMVDKYTGRVGYAVMSFGGHFGFGASLFPLPWAVLDYDEDIDGYVLNITREELSNAPRFEASDEPEFTPSYRRSIMVFYREPAGEGSAPQPSQPRNEPAS
jgi:hypothetical protein